MPVLIGVPPFSRIDPVTEILHGVQVTDPYRWLEDQDSPETRAWLRAQSEYARSYLDQIPGRERIRERVRELLDVETYDSFLKNGNRYFFRKRLRGQEQPSIYFREGPEGEDQLLINPAVRGTGDYTAVKPLRVSPDGSLLLYEVKQGGERMGRFEILDVASRQSLPDSLPHGYLRGFAFQTGSKGFYYVHENPESKYPFYRAAHYHAFGTKSELDQEIFFAGDDERTRLHIIVGRDQLGFIVYRFLDKTYIDFYLWAMANSYPPTAIVRNAAHSFSPRFLPGRILAAIDNGAPNYRVVDVQVRRKQEPLYFDVVRETDARIRNWWLTRSHILVSYAQDSTTYTEIFDHFGKYFGRILSSPDTSQQIVYAHSEEDEIFLEQESFAQPMEVHRYLVSSGEQRPWSKRQVPFNAAPYKHVATSFLSKDATPIPISLFGECARITAGTHPMIMSSYGGYGISAVPQFSVLVALLVERGCVFALPGIRGGSEFGRPWHDAAKRRNRQVAFDDFLAAAEWLIASRRTISSKLAIFGGSNSGLLVAVALTQHPEMFRAVLCLVPLTDMLRFHHFDGAHVWKEEFGTAEDGEDFKTLASYSPYHAVRKEVAYPATLLVSGGADQNCNSLHARKMTARLQAATVSGAPILLAYNGFRGHSPVLPLSERIEALTDRVSFLCHQLGIPMGGVS